MSSDYDLIILGAGSGGIAAAERAATYGARVAIAEQGAIGGACINYGCIPEKLLDYAATVQQYDRLAASYGWKDVPQSGYAPGGQCDRQFDWVAFIAAKDRHIQHLHHLHQHNLEQAKITLFQGCAHFSTPHTVIVGEQALSAEKILIAVGAKPAKPNIPGVEQSITWRELYQLPTQPQHVAVFGGDPLGVKIAGSLHALGTRVTLILPSDRILTELDAEISRIVQDQLVQQGVQVMTQTEVKQIEAAHPPDRSGYRLTLSGQSAGTLTVDTVLMDAPRVPNLAALQLDKVGIQLTASGAIRVDAFSRTTQTNIFAIGDCTDRIPLTPSAIAQGRAFADTEWGGHPHSVNLDWIPLSISSRPEAAIVGLSEAQARDHYGDAVYCYRTQFQPLLYSLGRSEEKTLMKVIVNRQDKERVLGVGMVGTDAVEIIQTLAVALKLGATKHDLDTTIGIHPSSAEELFSI